MHYTVRHICSNSKTCGKHSDDYRQGEACCYVNTFDDLYVAEEFFTKIQKMENNFVIMFEHYNEHDYIGYPVYIHPSFGVYPK